MDNCSVIYQIFKYIYIYTHTHTLGFPFGLQLFKMLSNFTYMQIENFSPVVLRRFSNFFFCKFTMFSNTFSYIQRCSCNYRDNQLLSCKSWSLKNIKQNLEMKLEKKTDVKKICAEIIRK